MFIVISGVSGSGKNTIINALIKQRKKLKVLKYSTATTREERESDKENKTYVFMSREDFERGIAEEKFFEYENVHGNFYGTILERLNSVIGSKYDYIRDIDVHGNLKLRAFYKDKCPIASIFIDAPDEELIKRLKNRGESDESIAKRLSRGELERSHKNEYDLVIDNIDLDKTLKTINDFLDNFAK